MSRPTQIEALDRSLPGLVDQVKAWFDQGVPVRQVVELLRQQYNQTVPRSTLGNFRVRRWARDRELRLEKQAEATANGESVQMLGVKDAFDTNLRGVEK